MSLLAIIAEIPFLLLFVSGPIAAVVYANRNRSPLAGYLLGALLGPLGLLIVAMAKPLPPTGIPPTNPETSAERVRVQQPRQTAPMNGTAAPSSAIQALSQLKQLAEAGLINQDEYMRKKAEILARM